MKQFKRQSDLIKHACKRVLDRQAATHKAIICKTRQQGMSGVVGDFLEQVRRKLKGVG